jgi:hypothetical protein
LSGALILAGHPLFHAQFSVNRAEHGSGENMVVVHWCAFSQAAQLCNEKENANVVVFYQ